MRAAVQTLKEDMRALRALQTPEQVIWDPRVGEWVVSHAAFKRQSDGTISVDLEEIQKLNHKPLTHGYPRVRRSVGLIAHTIGRLKQATFVVTHAPIARGIHQGVRIKGNVYHGVARGKLSRTARQALADTCEIIVPLDGCAAQRHHDEKLAEEAQRAKEQRQN